MLFRGTVVLGVVLIAAVAPGELRAQTTAVMNAGGGATPFTLEGVGGNDPFVAGGLGDGSLLGGSRTGVNAVLNTSVGFSYLRPLWSDAGLELRPPAGSPAAVGIANPAGELSRTFAFVPRLDVTYDTSNVGVGGSFQYLGLGGTLDRTVNLSGGGTASLLATNNLSVLSVGLPEVRNTVFVGPDNDRWLLHWLGLTNSTLVGTLGTRYTAIRQDYHASLTSGSSVATTDATQSFNGLGLTVGFELDRPLGTHWGLYSNNRWTLLLGQNSRKSTSAGGDAGGPFSNSLSENKTTLFPVGELEVGFRYLTAWNDPTARATGATGRQLFMRAGFVGQYYNGIAFLPAAGTSARFTDRPLFLIGFSVTAGVEF